MMRQIQFIEGSDIPYHLDDSFRELSGDTGCHDQDHILAIDRTEQDNEFVQWLISDQAFEFDDGADQTYVAIRGL